MSLFDDVFEIETKYHNFIAFLLILTRILSYQDCSIVRNLFLLLLTKVCILLKLKIISLEILVEWLYPFFAVSYSDFGVFMGPGRPNEYTEHATP